jgi:hypothetical protein
MTVVHGKGLVCRYISTTLWIVDEPLVVDLDCLGTRVTVPAGFVFDFNSVPRFLWRLLPPTDFGEAGAVHDYLYRRDCVPCVKRVYADQAHRELMEWHRATVRAIDPEMEPAAWRVAAYYRGLRVGGGGSFHHKDVAWRPAGLILPEAA